MAQTIIKTNVCQPAMFFLGPQKSYIPFEQGTQVLIGNNLEIYGGSGHFTFSWELNGSQLSTEPLLTVDKPGNYTLTVNDGVSCLATAYYYVGTGTSVNFNNSQAINIYPNPVKNHFFIDYQNNLDIKNITIYNLSGQLLKQFNINIANESGIDVSDLYNGHYMVVFTTNKNKITKLLLKQ